jgi:IstB-like ATP binding protein
LACALGHKACRDGFSVLYRRAPRLFADLATARGERRLARLMRSLERTRLLVIDDWGPEPLNAEQRRDLLEIVDDREGAGPCTAPSSGRVNSAIRITGVRDRDRPEWLIRINGIRSSASADGGYCSVTTTSNAASRNASGRTMLSRLRLL